MADDQGKRAPSGTGAAGWEESKTPVASPPPAPPRAPTISVRAQWYAIGSLRDEFAQHRKEDREDFNSIRSRLDGQASEVGDIKAMCSGFDAKLDSLLTDRAHARKTATVALVQTEQTKRTTISTRGKLIAGVLGLLAAIATALGATGAL